MADQAVETSRSKQLTEPLVCFDSRLLDEEPQARSQSKNVNLILAYSALTFAGQSIWSQSVLSTFVYLLRNDNPEAVGFVTVVMGISQLIASFPTGLLMDRYRRDSFLKVASVVGLVAVGVTLFSVYKNSYRWITVALAIWGIFWDIASTSLSALFPDSIPEGDRSFFFTRISVVQNIGYIFGPGIALALFASLGDKWTLHDCAIVMCYGQMLCLPAVLLLCFLNDNKALHDDEDLLAEALLPSTPQSTGTGSSGSSEGNSSYLESEEEAYDESPDKMCCCVPEHRYIPVLISLADILSGLGSGMSIRYFPIFFFENLKLSPVVVQTLYMLSPMGQATLMHAGQLWSRRLGRCKVAVVFKWIGVTCTMTMIVFYMFHLPTWLVCCIYLVRTSFMNATSALTKSVLMDVVPKHERGKWSALESVNMFSWSGSAALGGLLVGFRGILFNFVVTGLIQFLATLPLVCLFSRDGAESEAATMRPRPRPSTFLQSAQRTFSIPPKK